MRRAGREPWPRFIGHYLITWEVNSARSLPGYRTRDGGNEPDLWLGNGADWESKGQSDKRSVCLSVKQNT